MKENVTLTVFSLLTIALAIVHLAQDVVRGMSPGGYGNYLGVLILVIWLYGALVLAGRRSGYIIILLISLLMAGVPAIHMRGPGIGFGTHRSSGVVFVGILLALGVTAMFSAILAARELWRLSRRPG